MPTTTATDTPPVKRKPPTTKQVLADQKRQVERDRALVPSAAVSTTLPTKAAPPTAVTWLDEGDPGTPGRTIQFNGKEGCFYFTDTDEDVSRDTRFIARCDNVRIGRIKFNEKGTRPDRTADLWYPAFRLPPRGELGDTDPAKWKAGLNGQPEDPWKEYVELVLQQTDHASELCCFVTMSETGRRSIRPVLRCYVRLCKKNGGAQVFPVIQLVPGGYSGKFGWVHTPDFRIVGETSASDPAKAASLAEDLNDELPTFG